MSFLFKKNKITSFQGTGSLAGTGKVLVTPDKGGSPTTIETKHIVIATGSVPATLPGIEIDEERIVTSTGALSLGAVPERLLVIGAGVIGLELGSVWARLGAKVTVVEFLDRILPGMDSEVARQFQRILQKQGVEFRLSTKVSSIDKQDDGSLTVRLEPAAGGDMALIDADVALVAIGRKPFTEGLGLKEAGVELDDRGRIVTGQRHYGTNVENVYAIGDVIVGPMLAHKAEDEGIAVAEIIAGQAGHVNYGAMPAVVYTNPEIASVGKTEDELKAAGIDYKVGKFPFTANGRAKAMLATQGFVKVLADVATDRVLGAHIIGKNASEMIEALTVLMEFGGSAEDLARTTAAAPDAQRSHPRSRADVRRRRHPHLRRQASHLGRLDLCPLGLALRPNSQTPTSTSAVPAACHGVKASPSTPIGEPTVTIGETLPMIAVRSGPIRPMPAEMQ